MPERVRTIAAVSNHVPTTKNTIGIVMIAAIRRAGSTKSVLDGPTGRTLDAGPSGAHLAKTIAPVPTTIGTSIASNFSRHVHMRDSTTRTNPSTHPSGGTTRPPTMSNSAARTAGANFVAAARPPPTPASTVAASRVPSDVFMSLVSLTIPSTALIKDGQNSRNAKSVDCPLAKFRA